MKRRGAVSEAQERIRKARDQAATLIATDYGLQFVDVRPLLERMSEAEVRRILTEQGIKPIGTDTQ